MTWKMEKLVVLFGKFYRNFMSRVLISKLNFVAEIYMHIIVLSFYIHVNSFPVLSISFLFNKFSFNSVNELCCLLIFNEILWVTYFKFNNVFIMKTSDCYDVLTNGWIQQVLFLCLKKEKLCLTSDKYFFFHKFTFYEIERLVSMTLLCEEDRC